MSYLGGIWVYALPGAIQRITLQTRWLIGEIIALQTLVSPDNMAALDQWSDEPGRSTRIKLRISRKAIIYQDSTDRCEIEIPGAIAAPLRLTSTADSGPAWHMVQAESRSYYP
jgi:hypothetical protein